METGVARSGRLMWRRRRHISPATSAAAKNGSVSGRSGKARIICTKSHQAHCQDASFGSPIVAIAAEDYPLSYGKQPYIHHHEERSQDHTGAMPPRIQGPAALKFGPTIIIIKVCVQRDANSILVKHALYLSTWWKRMGCTPLCRRDSVWGKVPAVTGSQ